MTVGLKNALSEMSELAGQLKEINENWGRGGPEKWFCWEGKKIRIIDRDELDEEEDPFDRLKELYERCLEILDENSFFPISHTHELNKQVAELENRYESSKNSLQKLFPSYRNTKNTYDELFSRLLTFKDQRISASDPLPLSKFREENQPAKGADRRPSPASTGTDAESKAPVQPDEAQSDSGPIKAPIEIERKLGEIQTKPYLKYKKETADWLACLEKNGVFVIPHPEPSDSCEEFEKKTASRHDAGPLSDEKKKLRETFAPKPKMSSKELIERPELSIEGRTSIQAAYNIAAVHSAPLGLEQTGNACAQAYKDGVGFVIIDGRGAGFGAESRIKEMMQVSLQRLDGCKVSLDDLQHDVTLAFDSQEMTALAIGRTLMLDGRLHCVCALQKKAALLIYSAEAGTMKTVAPKGEAGVEVFCFECSADDHIFAISQVDLQDLARAAPNKNMNELLSMALRAAKVNHTLQEDDLDMLINACLLQARVYSTPPSLRQEIVRLYNFIDAANRISKRKERPKPGHAPLEERLVIGFKAFPSECIEPLLLAKLADTLPFEEKHELLSAFEIEDGCPLEKMLMLLHSKFARLKNQIPDLIKLLSNLEKNKPSLTHSAPAKGLWRQISLEGLRTACSDSRICLESDPLALSQGSLFSNLLPPQTYGFIQSKEEGGVNMVMWQDAEFKMFTQNENQGYLQWSKIEGGLLNISNENDFEIALLELVNKSNSEKNLRSPYLNSNLAVVRSFPKKGQKNRCALKGINLGANAIFLYSMAAGTLRMVGEPGHAKMFRDECRSEDMIIACSAGFIDVLQGGKLSDIEQAIKDSRFDYMVSCNPPLDCQAAGNEAKAKTTTIFNKITAGLIARRLGHLMDYRSKDYLEDSKRKELQSLEIQLHEAEQELGQNNQRKILLQSEMKSLKEKENLKPILEKYIAEYSLSDTAAEALSFRELLSYQKQVEILLETQFNSLEMSIERTEQKMKEIRDGLEVEACSLKEKHKDYVFLVAKAGGGQEADETHTPARTVQVIQG